MMPEHTHTHTNTSTFQAKPMKMPYIKGNNTHIYSIICIYTVRYLSGIEMLCIYERVCIKTLQRVVQGVGCINLLMQLTSSALNLLRVLFIFGSACCSFRFVRPFFVLDFLSLCSTSHFVLITTWKRQNAEILPVSRINGRKREEK